MQKIILTSDSEIKGNAVEAIFSPYIYEILKLKSVSGVPEQPMGFEQIEEGARNRIKSVTPKTECEFDDVIYVSIENGIVNIQNKYYDTACIVLSFNGIVSICWSSMVEMKEQYVNEIPTDQSKTYAEIIFEKGLTNNKKDPHESICDVSRQEILEQALKIAKGTLVNFYKNDSEKSFEGDCDFLQDVYDKIESYVEKDKYGELSNLITLSETLDKDEICNFIISDIFKEIYHRNFKKNVVKYIISDDKRMNSYIIDNVFDLVYEIEELFKMTEEEISKYEFSENDIYVFKTIKETDRKMYDDFLDSILNKTREISEESTENVKMFVQFMSWDCGKKKNMTLVAKRILETIN